MTRHCLALDLKNEPALIEEYDNYHKQVWPEIKQSLRDSGIEHMEIYRTGNRLFMIIEAADHFSFDEKRRLDAANPKVEEWESLMWKYQQELPGVKPGEKWVLMEKVFTL